jgi:hypothetical protein
MNIRSISWWKKLAKENKVFSALLMLFLTFKLLIGIFPQFVDGVYRNSFFQLLRIIYDNTIGLLPFPLIYIILFLLLFFIVKKWKETAPEVNKWKLRLSSLGKLLLSLYFLFYILWGFNYQTSKVSEILSLNIEISQDQINEAFSKSTASVNRIADDSLKQVAFDVNELQNHLREIQKVILANMSLKTNGEVHIKKLYPAGVLLRISTSGIYMPYAGEGYIDAGLHDFQIPFTMAHEMAHGYGITDEGECNFLAYITCMASDRTYVKYSAEISYWRYLYGYAREYAKANDIKVTFAFKKDLDKIYDQMDLYPDIMPKIRNFIYDMFLKSNGVNQGLKSYTTFVKMVIANENKQGK